MAEVRNKIRVMMSGYLAKEPEIKVSKSGKEFAVFGLGISELDKTSERDVNGFYQSKTRWYNMIAFDFEVVNHLKHVSPRTELSIEGELTWDSWTTSDGCKKEKITIIVFNVRGGINTNQQSNTQSSSDGDAIPF